MGLTCRENKVQLVGKAVQIQVWHPSGPRIAENEFAQGCCSVSYHMRKIFERKRNDCPAAFAGRSDEKHARLSLDVHHALENEIATIREFGSITHQFLAVANGPDSGAAAANIRLCDERKSEARILKGAGDVCGLVAWGDEDPLWQAP